MATKFSEWAVKLFGNGKMQSGVADAADAVAFEMDTANDMVTVGAKLLSVKDAGVEKAYIDKDGNLYSADNITAGDTIVGPYGVIPIVIGNTSATSGSLILRAGNKSTTTGGSLSLYSRGTGNLGGFELLGATVGAEKAFPASYIKAANQYPSAVTSLYGQDLDISAGDGASGSAGNAYGGNVVLAAGTGYGTGSDGLIVMPNLPTADPAVAGALWNNAGVLTVSAG